MTEFCAADSNANARRRSPAIIPLVALALLQVSFALHHIQHADAHGLNVCELCAAYSQLEDGAVDSAPLTERPTSAIAVAQPRAVLPATKSPLRSYRSRAPPRS